MRHLFWIHPEKTNTPIKDLHRARRRGNAHTLECDTKRVPAIVKSRQAWVSISLSGWQRQATVVPTHLFPVSAKQTPLIPSKSSWKPIPRSNWNTHQPPPPHLLLLMHTMPGRVAGCTSWGGGGGGLGSSSSSSFYFFFCFKRWHDQICAISRTVFVVKNSNQASDHMREDARSPTRRLGTPRNVKSMLVFSAT